MSVSCQHEHDFDGASAQYKQILVFVIAINAIMFVVELVFGIRGQSQSLKADALDFLADSTTYAMSLWAIGRPLSTRSRVALIKGLSLFLMAVWVLASTVYYIFYSNTPDAPTMGWVALLALAANLISVLLLVKYRDGDANIRSVWLCSRNDAIGNVGVLLAAAAVMATGSHWPDLLVALMLAGLFTSSAFRIVRQALAELKHQH